MSLDKMMLRVDVQQLAATRYYSSRSMAEVD